MLLNTLLLVVFVGIVFSGIAVSTFLVGTEGNKRLFIQFSVRFVLVYFCFLKIL